MTCWKHWSHERRRCDPNPTSAARDYKRHRWNRGYSADLINERGVEILRKQAVMPAIAAVALLVLFASTRVSDLDLVTITRDPAQLSGSSVWTGAVQYLGIAFWIVAAGVALFAARHASNRQQARWLTHVGYLTAWLAFDDLFQFHETIAPNSLGIPEKLVEGSYVFVALLLIAVHREVLRGVAPLAAALTAGGLGLSVAGDFFGLGIPVEETAKVLGISALANLVVIHADMAIRANPAQSSQSPLR